MRKLKLILFVLLTMCFMSVDAQVQTSCDESYQIVLKDYMNTIGAKNVAKNIFAEQNKELLRDKNEEEWENLLNTYLDTQFEDDFLHYVLIPYYSEKVSAEQLKKMAVERQSEEFKTWIKEESEAIKLFNEDFPKFFEKVLPSPELKSKRDSMGLSKKDTIQLTKLVSEMMIEKLESLPSADYPEDYKTLFSEFYKASLLSGGFEIARKGIQEGFMQKVPNEFANEMFKLVPRCMYTTYMGSCYKIVSEASMRYAVSIRELKAVQDADTQLFWNLKDLVKERLQEPYLSWLSANLTIHDKINFMQKGFVWDSK